MNSSAFRKRVWDHYRQHGRHDLPWRKTKDPYRIFVSEVMLQQTQVPRVLEKYKEFLATFPTVQDLAQAELGTVLKVWNGMGYNRRGKYLRDAAKAIVERHRGNVPRELADLRALPGIGPYTASAVRIFAFNLPDTFIETNVRAAYIHDFFPDKKKVSDATLMPLIAKASIGQDPRTWHWALMDYGAHLKKLHKNPSRKSAHYVRQSKFEGSVRQVRGAILRELHKERSSVTELPFGKARIEEALVGLERDGMIRKKKGEWVIA